MSEFGFITSGEQIGSGEDFIATRDGFTDEFIADTFILGDTFTVFWERDIDNDGNYEVSIELDTIGPGISDSNTVPVNEHQGVRLRLRNDGSAPADVTVTGDMQ